MACEFSQFPVFVGLGAGALGLLAGEARELRLRAGEVAVAEGERDYGLFLLADGRVKVCMGFGTAEETELARLDTGDFFGEMCLLETLGHSATVVALEECRLTVLPAGAFLRLYGRMPDQYGIFMLNLARDISRCLRRMDTRAAGSGG